MTFICILTLLSCVLACTNAGEPHDEIFFSKKPGPLHPATKGRVWPEPQKEETLSAYYVFVSVKMMIKITHFKCEILVSAIRRHMDIMMNLSKIANRYKSWNNYAEKEPKLEIKQLLINLTSPCEEYPYYNMNEKYYLRVSASSDLTSDSIWGILLGLETFTQLYYISDDYTEIRINQTTIEDYPSYPHRGLMLDTARHYISMENILKNLDAMAMNKMNVFHWHLTDDESFPYQSSKLPDLSRLGAFQPHLVYTHLQIKTIIQYARDRGIRVLPEFDVPGHTASWGLSHPRILTECRRRLGPLDPLNPSTYKLLQTLFTEIKSVFVDKYLHIGGDEVDFYCWLSNPDIREYMHYHNISNPIELQATTTNRIIKLLDTSITPIVWQEAYHDLPLNTVVQVWKPSWRSTMVDVLSKNMSIILSSPWYLDYLDRTFIDMYSKPPRSFVQDMVPKDKLKLIIGGEACMWGEFTDDTNLLSRTWPRASASAELLWSPRNARMSKYMKESEAHDGRMTDKRMNHVRMMWSDTLNRAAEHACRMQRRGVPASPPVGPGFCLM